MSELIGPSLCGCDRANALTEETAPVGIGLSPKALSRSRYPGGYIPSGVLSFASMIFFKTCEAIGPAALSGAAVSYDNWLKARLAEAVSVRTHVINRFILFSLFHVFDYPEYRRDAVIFEIVKNQVQLYKLHEITKKAKVTIIFFLEN